MGRVSSVKKLDKALGGNLRRSFSGRQLRPFWQGSIAKVKRRVADFAMVASTCGSVFRKVQYAKRLRNHE